MKINLENSSAFIRKRIIPAILVGGIIVTLIAISRGGGNNDIDPTQTEAPSLVKELSPQTAEQSASSSTDDSGIVTDPSSGLIYQSVSPPVGFEEWTCFAVPPGGNFFRTILYGGTSLETRYDTPDGVLFKQGMAPILVNVTTDVESWPEEVSRTQPGDIGCSR